MNNQHLIDLLYAQWRLLWPLSPSERLERIELTRLDMEFELQMSAVELEMSMKMECA